MDDKTKAMLEYFGIVDEVEKYGGHVSVSKCETMPAGKGGIAFIRIILAVSDKPVKGKVV
jgi:hypothetical protein